MRERGKERERERERGREGDLDIFSYFLAVIVDGVSCICAAIDEGVIVNGENRDGDNTKPAIVNESHQREAEFVKVAVHVTLHQNRIGVFDFASEENVRQK
jgi:hypothetical protein